MSQPDIVKIIQKCDTWSEAYRTDDEHEWYVKVYFKDRADAEAFKVEMMMVASGQRGYKPADDQQSSSVASETK